MAREHSPHTPSIHILDDDSLLNVFYLYRPFLLGEDQGDNSRLIGGEWQWVGERWWYKLAHVCRRWRVIILGSAFYLGLCLVCTFGTPVEDMLAHSPPLPLIIDYTYADWDVTAEEEQRIIFALEQRDRVRRVRLQMPRMSVPNLQKLVMAIDEEYPVLEYLITESPKKAALVLPETLQAPHLRHLVLNGFVFPIGSQLLTTAVGLVTLVLDLNHPSAYFHPNVLLRWLSIMPQLEMLAIVFSFPVSNRDVERQLMITPIRTHATLPNLRWFSFHGVSAYMEAVVQRITTPRLEKLSIQFFKQLTFSLPRLLQFLDTAENLRFNRAEFRFYAYEIRVEVYPDEEAEYSISMNVICYHLDWQVSCVAQIFNSLSQILSTVEHLALEHWEHNRSSEEHNEVDSAEWRKLLGSFSNVKTLRVDNGLVKELSRSLQPDDGELPLELLPELQQLTYTGSGDTDDAFTSFIDARQNAGRPVTLVRPSPRSVSPLSRGSSPGVSDRSSLVPFASGSSEAGSDLDT